MIMTIVATIVIISSNDTSQSGSWQKQTADPRGHRPDREGAVQNLARQGLWEVPTGVVALGTVITRCPMVQREGCQPLSPSTSALPLAKLNWSPDTRGASEE